MVFSKATDTDRWREVRQFPLPALNAGVLDGNGIGLSEAIYTDPTTYTCELEINEGARREIRPH